MSEVSTYVRARNGMLYLNPILLADFGFVCFDDVEPPELVLWAPAPGVETITPAEALVRFLGERPANKPKGWGLMNGCRIAERLVPFTNPQRFAQAACYFFVLTERMPMPTHSDGEERYASRLRGQHVIDMPASTDDYARIEIDPHRELRGV